MADLVSKANESKDKKGLGNFLELAKDLARDRTAKVMELAAANTTGFELILKTGTTIVTNCPDGPCPKCVAVLAANTALGLASMIRKPKAKTPKSEEKE